MRYPKFEKAIQDKIETTSQTVAQTGYGMIVDYNTYYNTATIIMANQGSNQWGEVFRDVPCPTMIGIQTMAPEPGRMCLVVFKDGFSSSPMITNYFNHVYNKIDYKRQTEAVNAIPRYMIAM